MSKLLFTIIPCLLMVFFGCYEPTEGCLDIDATNYSVASDDPCSDCCTFPALNLSVRHVANFTDPDTSLSFKYNTFYPSPFNSLDSFLVDRSRFYISDLQLIKENGDAVSVNESLVVSTADENTETISDNFTTVDRDIFATRKVGTILTEGIFNEIRFRIGLDDFLLQNELTSEFLTGHPLNTSEETILYEEGTGYIPNLLILSLDTVPRDDSLEFRFFESVEYNLPLESPFVVERGFNVSLTLEVDHMAIFKGVDFGNVNQMTMMEVIQQNFKNVISVTEIKLE